MFGRRKAADIKDLKATVRELQETVAWMADTMSSAFELARETRTLVGPFAAPMPDGTMLVQTIHGPKYLIDPNDRVMAPPLIVHRDWEPDLSRLFLNSLNPSSVVVDVGANFGYFSCLAAYKIGRSGTGQVWSFEPNPRLVPLLEDNCWRINWSIAPIHLRPHAVGAENGKVTLSVPRHGAANASLTMSGDHDQVEVEMVVLDEVIPTDLAVDLMKIDVEGHELAVLRGARQLVDRSPDLHIVMEWSLDQLMAANTSADDMLRCFEDMCLVPKRIPPSAKLNDATPFDPNDLRSLQYDNIILTKR